MLLSLAFIPYHINEYVPHRACLKAIWIKPKHPIIKILHINPMKCARARNIAGQKNTKKQPFDMAVTVV